MDSKDKDAEISFLLHILEKIVHLNSRGKSKEIADEIRPILKNYGR